MFRRRAFTRQYDVPPDLLRHALVVALPSVTTQAAFYDHDRRVEWTTDTTGWSSGDEYRWWNGREWSYDP